LPLRSASTVVRFLTASRIVLAAGFHSKEDLLAVGFFHFVEDFFANLVNACLAVPGYVDFSGFDFVADFEDSVLVECEWCRRRR